MQELMGSGDHSAAGWNPKTGLWGTSNGDFWWQSALAVSTIVRYAERTHSIAPVYQRVLLQTYRHNVYGARWQFANQYMDDTAWWGLAWLAASQYELVYRHDVKDAMRFLATSEWEARYIAAHPRPCGGIEWSVGTPPNTIANAQFITLAAELYRYRTTPGPVYNPTIAATWLSDAQTALTWFENSRLINLHTGRVTDSLTPACQLTGSSLTYTEGAVADALTQMGNIIGDPSYYQDAAAFLNYAISPASGLTSNGILQEHCEATYGACSQVRFRLDLPAFKGIFINAVVDFEASTQSSAYSSFLQAQANAVIQNAIRGPRNDLAHCATPHTCQFSFHWTGARDPAPIGITVGGQESALDALTAVLPS
jgi:Glycosyl hydrolase family 76